MHAFAARSSGLALGKRGLLAQIEWHGAEEEAWTLRETTPGTLRASAYRDRRGARASASVIRRQRMGAWHRPIHIITRR
jgi:NAD(P) transhydrogenase subunit beta